MSEIKGLTLRQLFNGDDLPYGKLFYTTSVFVDGVGAVAHCLLIDRFLDSAQISALLLKEGFRVLSADELDLCVETADDKMPKVSLNALGSHWTEGSSQLVRRYDYRDRDGQFKKSLGLYNDRWGQGYWFSCKPL